MKEVFSDIYRRWAWGEDCESVSGPGSSVASTSVFRDDIAVLLKEFNVRTVLDAGCGDFNWLRLVKLDLERYIGIDVVPELISENRRQYGNVTRTFLNVDLSREKLPKVDLILSRDCLVHFSNKDVSKAIKNLKESGSTYLLTTTFAPFDGNPDIDTGCWRPLNLQKSPFNFPEPLKLIVEKRRDSDGVSVVKYLGLWALEDIPLPGNPAN
jgi:SAM-dependent methyltransferase